MKKEEIKTSLETKNGVYYIRLRYKDNSGKWCSTRRKTDIQERGGKKKAQALIDSYVDSFVNEYNAENTEISNDNAVTFNTVVDSWYYAKEQTVKKTTAAGYFSKLRTVKAFFDAKNGENYPVAKMIVSDIQDFYSNLREKELSENTISNYHIILQMIFEYAEKREIISKNIMRKVERPKFAKKQGSFYDIADIQKIDSMYAENDIMGLIVSIAMYAGLRRSEICGLMWSNIDLEKRVINVCQTAILVKSGKNGAELHIAETTKTASSRRKVPICQHLYRKLLYWHNVHEERCKNKNFGKTSKGNFRDFICVRPDGTLINTDTITLRWHNEIRKCEDLQHLRFHDLRHSYATFLLRNGAKIQDVQHLLGHSTFNTTMDIYSHTIEEDLTNTMSLFDRAENSSNTDTI